MVDVSEINSYHELSNGIKVLMSFIGLWPKENPSIFYRFRSYYCLALFFSASVLLCTSIARNIGNIKVFIPCFGILLVVILSTVKAYCLLIHAQKLLWFHQTVQTLCDEWMSDKELTNILLSDTSTLWIVVRFYWSVASTSCIAGIMLPLISFVKKVIHHVQPIKYRPIIPAAYFWNPATNYLFYLLHNLAEAQMLICAFYVAVLTDALFSFSIYQMVIPLRAMSHCLIHLSPDANYEQILHKCIFQYATLIKCRNVIQKAYWPIILSTAGTAPITLCSLLWQVIQMTTITLFQKVQFASHSLGKTMQVFSYSWSATLLITQNEQYLGSVYASDWCGNKKNTISVLTMLIQRPLAITVSPTVNVNLAIFVFAMKTALSYYLLLQTLEERS